jgi:hypothetical protein
VLWYRSRVVRFSVYHATLPAPGAPGVIGGATYEQPEVFSGEEARSMRLKLEFGPLFRGQTQAVDFGLWHGTQTVNL